MFVVFSLLFSVSTYAISDGSFYNAYSLGYSNAIGLFPLKSNPATYGDIRNLTISSYYSQLRHLSYGRVDLNTSGFELYLPHITYGENLTYYFGYEKNEAEKDSARILNFGISSYNLFDFETEHLDIGLNFKNIKSQNRVDPLDNNFFDIGFLVRKKEYLFGLSFININSSFNTRYSDIKVLKTTKLSLTRKNDEYMMGIDITKTSDINSYSFGFSASTLYRTYRYGSLKPSVSMTIGNKKNIFGFGVFYERDIFELGYCASLSLDRVRSFNNSITLSVYFGKRDIQSDYEKIIQREVSYRKSLMNELIEAQKREDKLKVNIAKMKAEIDELTYRLNKLDEQLENEKENKQKILEEKAKIKKELEGLLEKQKQREDEIRYLEEKRRLEKIKLTEMEFNKDYESYIKLKSQGVARDVLINYLKKVILSYQDSGIDISRATLELQNLLKQ